MIDEISEEIIKDIDAAMRNRKYGVTTSFVAKNKKQAEMIKYYMWYRYPFSHYRIYGIKNYESLQTFSDKENLERFGGGKFGIIYER